MADTKNLEKQHDNIKEQVVSIRKTVIDNIRLFTQELGQRLADEDVDTEGYLDLGRGIIVSSEDANFTESIVGVALQQKDWEKNPFMVDVEFQGPTAAYGADALTIDTLLAILKSVEELSDKSVEYLGVSYFE